MVNKKIPGALLAVVVAIVASYALDLQADGVTILGTIPSGLPPIGLPTDGHDHRTTSRPCCRRSSRSSS